MLTADDLDDLVDMTAIADRSGWSRASAWKWVHRTRAGIARDPFPDPIVHLAIGPVWYWPDVAAWLDRTGRTRTP